MITLIYSLETDIDKQAFDVVQLLSANDYGACTLATAESCTGGLLSGAVTGVAGAGEVFEVGICTYANRAKTALLGVSPDTLAAHGAVSEPVSREMARGVKKLSGADFALSTTGVAGPGPLIENSVEKPAGTVHICCASPFGERHIVLSVSAPDVLSDEEKRQYVRLYTVREALRLLLDTFPKNSPRKD